MTNFRQWKALLLSFILPVTSSRSLHRQHAVTLSNDSEDAIAIEWYNPATQKNVPFTHMEKGESVQVNSFANHTFVVHYDNETCADEVCRSTVIVVNDNENQVVTVKDHLELELRDDSTKAKYEAEDIVNQCKAGAKKRLEMGLNPKTVLTLMQGCVEKRTAEVFKELHEEEMFQATLRQSISDKIEDYTCYDKDMETTQAEETTEWKEENTNVTRKVHLFHDRKASKIHMLEHFISPEECQAITDAAAPKLHHGTVADGKGGSKLSDHRKAMQAGIRIPWELEEQGNLIAKVFRRIYAYTNHVTGFGIKVEGQEDLMSIQYFGRGEGDEAPDRYKPHCDGDCNGLPHKKGGRVATMVMYCDTEGLVGGATNFGHAGVYVKPKVGAAAFFSYLDPETHVHETGFTTHSGCPVVEGRKRIAVHWMRIGVDSDRPWDSFDTNNIQKSECGDDE